MYGGSAGGEWTDNFSVFFASGKEEIQPSPLGKRTHVRERKNKKKKLRDISGCEHLDSARAAEVSDGRQSEQAVAHLSSTHSIILLFFSLHPPRFPHVLAVTLIRRRRQSDHVSRARVHLVSSSPRRASLCMRQAEDARGRTSVLPTSSDERSAFPACFVFNEAVGGGYGGAVGMWSP